MARKTTKDYFFVGLQLLLSPRLQLQLLLLHRARISDRARAFDILGLCVRVVMICEILHLDLSAAWHGLRVAALPGLRARLTSMSVGLLAVLGLWARLTSMVVGLQAVLQSLWFILVHVLIV